MVNVNVITTIKDIIQIILHVNLRIHVLDILFKVMDIVFVKVDMEWIVLELIVESAKIIPKVRIQRTIVKRSHAYPVIRFMNHKLVLRNVPNVLPIRYI